MRILGPVKQTGRMAARQRKENDASRPGAYRSKRDHPQTPRTTRATSSAAGIHPNGGSNGSEKRSHSRPAMGQVRSKPLCGYRTKKGPPHSRGRPLFKMRSISPEATGLPDH